MHCVFRLRSQQELEAFAEEVSALVDKKTVMRYYREATEEPFSFLYCRLEAKKAEDIDSLSLVKAPNTQITVPAATTLDVHGQWRIRKDLRLNVGIVNLTNRKYWMWSDVQGLAASTLVADAYTQPGRNLKLALVADF